jgi:hypothetical protein
MSKNNDLTEQARKNRTYNYNSEQKSQLSTEWVSYKATYNGDTKCLHKETVKKQLFTSFYHICKTCGEEI